MMTSKSVTLNSGNGLSFFLCWDPFTERGGLSFARYEDNNLGSSLSLYKFIYNTQIITMTESPRKT